MDYRYVKDRNDQPYLEVSVSDFALITNPLLNKGMAFSLEEREAFGLLGLIPPHQADLEGQRERSYEAFKNKANDLDKYIYLRDLQDSNETLFYYLLCTHLEELLPIVYTPTVGLGCQRFSHVYRRPRGIFIAYPYQHKMDSILANKRFDKVKAIVVSDGERILGLGDQGAGGMGIPIGKLALYTACAGIYPASTLPVFLDTGTNNPDLQMDPLYIGWRHERIRGQAYDDFIDTFVSAVKRRFPHLLLQWEDFAQLNAQPILERYKNQLCTFNDDIQGTASVAVGTLFAAMHVAGNSLNEQRIVVVGAGSAGYGISNLLYQAMLNAGISPTDAKRKFYLVDKGGLITDRTTGLLAFQKEFAQSETNIKSWKLKDPNNISLEEVVSHVHPTVLIGVSGQPGIFTEEIIRNMAAHTARPIIFPLSNPPTRCEAHPANIMKWTNDKALIGTGSPFGEIQKNGKFYRVDQTNNCYIFPGVGLGLIATKAKRVTDKMFMLAAKALSETSPAKYNPDANLLPPLSQIREVSLQVALAVAKEAIESGLSNLSKEINLEAHIKSYMWTPHYLRYVKV